MRKSIFVALICFAASVVCAAAGQVQPLNVQPGLWHMTATIKWTELPPQLAAMMKAAPPTRTYESCVTTKDLQTNPWANGSEDHCTWSVLNSTSTDMEVQATGCDFGEEFGMTAEVHGKIHVLDSENGTGSMTVTLTGSGQTLHGLASYTGKWINASCTAQ